MKKLNLMKATFTLAAAALLQFAPAAGAETENALDGHGNNTLEGVWRVTRTGIDCQTGQQFGSFPAIMTFHRGGTLTGDAVPPGASPANGSVEHGVWQRGPGHHNYSFRFVSNSYDNTGAYEGRAEITGAARLTSADTLTYTATIQFFDAAGNLLAQRCGVAQGARFE